MYGYGLYNAVKCVCVESWRNKSHSKALDTSTGTLHMHSTVFLYGTFSTSVLSTVVTDVTVLVVSLSVSVSVSSLRLSGRWSLIGVYVYCMSVSVCDCVMLMSVQLHRCSGVLRDPSVRRRVLK